MAWRATLLATASACSSLDTLCVLESARGEPAWVKHFSQAAAGPEQFHVNFGSTPDAVAVRWATTSSTATATVHWGMSAGALPNSASGATDRYVYSALYTSPWLHTVNLTGLPLATRIFYQVGDAATGLSPVMSFMSNPGVGPIYPFKTAFIADIGEAESANTTITRLLEATALGLVDSVVLNGDISYASGACRGGKSDPRRRARSTNHPPPSLTRSFRRLREQGLRDLGRLLPHGLSPRELGSIYDYAWQS